MEMILPGSLQRGFILIFLVFVFTAKAQSPQEILGEINSARSVKEKCEKINYFAEKKKISKFVFEKIIYLLDSLQPGILDKKEQGLVLFVRGRLMVSQQERARALEYYFEALKIFNGLNDLNEQLVTNNFIGDSYYSMDNYPAALKYFYESIRISEEIKNRAKRHFAESMIGTVFKDQQKFDSALFHHHIAMNISRELGDSLALASAYNDIGLTFKKKNEHEKALEYLLKALEIRERIHDVRGIAGANINIGNTLKRLERYKDAMPYYDKGIEVAAGSGNYDFYLNGIIGRARNLQKLGDFKKAASELSRYVESKDSINKLEINKQLAELDVNYQTEKKDADLKLQREQIKARTLENSRQRILIIASASALLLALVAIIFIYRSFQLNRKNARDLAFKNTVIEEKNRQIIDSIEYARKIQQSLITSEKYIGRNMERMKNNQSS